jgi:hypothetical protein
MLCSVLAVISVVQTVGSDKLVFDIKLDTVEMYRLKKIHVRIERNMIIVGFVVDQLTFCYLSSLMLQMERKDVGLEVLTAVYMKIQTSVFLRRVALVVRSDVWTECIISTIKLTKICKLGTTLTVISNRSPQRT